MSVEPTSPLSEKRIGAVETRMRKDWTFSYGSVPVASTVLFLAQEMDRLREDMQAEAMLLAREMDSLRRDLLARLPATDAGEPKTASDTTPTCESTESVDHCPTCGHRSLP